MDKSSYGLSWIYAKTKGLRPQLALCMLLALCLPAIQLVFSYQMKLLIDIATGDAELPLITVALRTVALVAVGGAILMVSYVLSRWITGRLECKLRADLLDTIFSRRMIALTKQHTGELLTKLTADTEAVSACPVAVIDNLVGGTASALLATAALFFLNWKIALLLLVLIPSLMLLMSALTPHIQKASAADKGNDEANRSLIQECLSRMMLIKTYCMQNKTIDGVCTAYQHKLRSGMRLGFWEGLAAFTGILFGNVMSLVTLGLGAYFVLLGETTVGSLIMIVQLLNYIVTPVSKFSLAAAQVSQAVVSAERIGTVCTLPPEPIITSARPVEAEALIVQDLRFSYGGAEDGMPGDVLDGVTMTFARGEVTGIAGTSGSGKSTLLKLLIGLYTPRSGTVELRHASGALSGEALMPQAAYVPPEDYLFSGTVADNILMAEPERNLARLRAAAAGANILDFIDSLPDSFDTPLGESGSTVSSGQAQRIAIARALYKNTALLVFDEPTANLDADSVLQFQSVLRQLAQDKICILVTHDASTLTICDKVYELTQGRVTERCPNRGISSVNLEHV